MSEQAGLVRPNITEKDAAQIAVECYGIVVTASELGSNQDRNFLLTEPDGSRSVLRVDNPVFSDEARDAQHAAIDAYRAAGVTVANVLPGLNGKLTQHWAGFAVRRSEFADGEPLVDAGYLAPKVIAEFGALAADSVNALATLAHPGLARPNMWDMRVAAAETVKLAEAIDDAQLRERVLAVAQAANERLEPIADRLPVQAIHGDLTDDNVMGVRGVDRRIHPHTLLDLGDLGYGWRVAELAVTLSSLLHHEPERPLRTLEAAQAFHDRAPLSEIEADALWPLVALRAALLVASGHRQLQIDGDNDYARERVAGELAIFDAATVFSLTEMTEQVRAALGFARQEPGTNVTQHIVETPLFSVLPDLAGDVVVLDLGVESELLDAGKWLAADAETQLVSRALKSAAAAVLPYGQYRLTRTAINSDHAAETWPIDTEIWLPAGEPQRVTTPLAGVVQRVTAADVLVEVGDGWLLRLSGVHASVHVGDELQAGDGVGEVPSGEQPWHSFTVGVLRADAPELQFSTAVATLVSPERVPAWSRFTHDPAALLGLESHSERDESADELRRRERIFASAQERYYERPMQIERGWRHHLIDTTGRSYIDMVNNVTGLGHGHPGVADAVNRQIRILNTNSRFLYRELAEYSERLLALLPEGSGLDTVLLVNSGSEAVDLALRLAQAATGRKTVVALREAYHGWTMASDAVTTSAYDNPYALENRPEWVHVADVPNRFRGTYRGTADDMSIGQHYAKDLANDISALEAAGRPIAGFICESVLGNAGGVMLPKGYLAEVYQRVREAGGVCIADEVQVGFGRMGSTFWGFEQSGVTPDIITIAKPMGNGFPIGGVITSKRIADALATQGQFFASAGGNPLSCRVGMAVLDAMQAEGLQQNAHVIGQRLIAGFTALAEKHDIIGPIHGEGLYLGVELVRDRETMEPAKEEADAICERLRELGVVVLTTSERSNVLKVKPPLCLTAESADFVLAQLDRVLTEGF